MKKLTLLLLFVCLNSILFAQTKSSIVIDESPFLLSCEETGTKDETKSCTEKKLAAYVYRNIRYPAAARMTGTQGLVVAQLVISETGKITKTSILKGIGNGCEEELERVLHTLNQNIGKWKPAQKDGKSVTAIYNFPIIFRLANGYTGKTQPTEFEGDTIFTYVDKMPTFNDCEEETTSSLQRNCTTKKVTEYIKENMKYPGKAIDKGVEGFVLVNCIITKTGEIKNIETFEGIGAGCEDEVIRIIKTMEGKWNAGTKKGKAVHFRYSFPVRFEITKEMKKARKQEIKEQRKNND